MGGEIRPKGSKKMINKIDPVDVRELNKRKTEGFKYMFDRINGRKDETVYLVKETIGSVIVFLIFFLFLFVLWVALLLFA